MVLKYIVYTKKDNTHRIDSTHRIYSNHKVKGPYIHNTCNTWKNVQCIPHSKHETHVTHETHLEYALLKRKVICFAEFLDVKHSNQEILKDIAYLPD